MPRSCAVPNCKGNYRSETAKVSVFSFPKDEELRNKWIRSIHRDNFTPTKYSVVCEKHFREIDFQVFCTVNGQQVETKRLVKKLVPTAVPSIFPNMPGYLTKPPPLQRTNPEERRRVQFQREETAIQEFMNEDWIINFNYFHMNVESHTKHLNGWQMYRGSSKIVFYIIEEDECGNVDFGIKIEIDVNLNVVIFSKGTLVPPENLHFILNKDCKLSLWSQLINLLPYFKNYRNLHLQSKGNAFEICSEALSTLINTNTKYQSQLRFMLDQIEMMKLKKLRYPPSMFVTSFIIHSHSPVTYNILREDYLVLPHPRTLQSISSSMNVRPDEKNCMNDLSYLQYIFSSLEEREKLVLLLIDEIYIKSGIQYKGSKVVGFAENSNNMALARTVQTFMVKSAFGKLEEVVRLAPVLNSNGDDLFKLTIEVLHLLKSVGFIVIGIITDDHTVNEELFKLMIYEFPTDSQGLCVELPFQAPHKTFLLHDSVHLFKNIRNNWINKKTPGSTLRYPDFDNPQENFKLASFSDIRSLHLTEKDEIVKTAFRLNHKTCYPNVFEKQNVSLVCNVFHETTVAALLKYGKRDTAAFVEIICRWWNIVNCKTLFKHQAKLNEWCAPILSPSDENLKFLNKFILWLNSFNISDNASFSLTKRTHQALLRTVACHIKIANVFLQSPLYDIEYILLGKFQTDALEARFRKYRTLIGRGYLVTLVQLAETEKKLRIQGIFSNPDPKKDYRVLMEGNDEIQLSNFEIPQSLNDILNTTDYLAENFENNLSTLYTYECGYAAHSICKQISCSSCHDLILESKGEFAGDIYFDYLQRGGLSLPTTQVIVINYHMLSIFQYILKDIELKNTFFAHPNQKQLLISLTIKSLYLLNYNLQFDFDVFCTECSYHHKDIFMKLCSPLANITLKTYCQNVADTTHTQAVKDSNARKLSTLKK